MVVVGCVGAVFLVVVWVVFGFWFGFFVVFGCGLIGLFSLVCMGLCCFLGVVGVSACWVCLGFHWFVVFWVVFLLLGEWLGAWFFLVGGRRFYGCFFWVLDDSSA